MTLDINRAWDNEFDSYPILLTHVETVVRIEKYNKSYDDGLFANNLPCVIILNADNALRRWRIGTAIYQKNDSRGIHKDAE